MLCVGAVSAQQALWSASKVVSPQINDDNSVTFRLAAPEAPSPSTIPLPTASP